MGGDKGCWCWQALWPLWVHHSPISGPCVHPISLLPPLPLTIIYVCKDLKCFSPLCSVKSGMPCTGRETKVCSEQAEKHCSLVVLMPVCWTERGWVGEVSVSLLALLLLLLLLDTCRSSCETSFPCFVLTQTCPHHLLALAALPRASVPQTPLTTCNTSSGDGGPFLPAPAGRVWDCVLFCFKETSWNSPALTHIHSPASWHNLPSIYHEDGCSASL